MPPETQLELGRSGWPRRSRNPETEGLMQGKELDRVLRAQVSRAQDPLRSRHTVRGGGPSLNSLIGPKLAQFSPEVLQGPVELLELWEGGTSTAA